MNNSIARQIAGLLNAENQLVVGYTEEKVLSASDNYVYEAVDGVIKAFIECKKVQWYQYEVCHLTVAPDFRGQGLGEVVINKALSYAASLGARIVQCTIRDDNGASKGLFAKCSFAQTSTFYYPNSGNNVGVWQKVVSVATYQAN
ncbi:MAG: GNAT family N-acetyltransferase [Alteromonadaceae bacterium]|nr:GNAT family N-acetyltransferase [Alteromonadaceae bacterium]